MRPSRPAAFPPLPPFITSMRVERDEVFGPSTPRQLAAQTLMVTGAVSGGYKGAMTIGMSA
jgi:hypothetical protein